MDEDIGTHRKKYMKRAKNDSNLYWIKPVEGDAYKTKLEQILIIHLILDVSSIRTIIFELFNHVPIINIASDL